MPPAPLLLLQDIRLALGSTRLLDGATLAVGAGERLALVGRNGSGKSSLMKVAAALIEADAGSRFLQPGSTVRYLPQEPDFGPFTTTFDYVAAGLGPGDDPYRVRFLFERLGLTGEEHPQRLSGGEARRAAIAKVLAPAPDILLLDEPTNHLDLPTIAWLEDELRSIRSALVLISHDRRFLESLSRAMVWLDRGATRRLDQGFAGFEAWRDTLLDQEEKEAHKLGRKIAREEDWLRYGVTARRKRNMRRVGELQALRDKRRQRVTATGLVKMAAAEGETSGALVISAEALTKGYGGAPVVREFSTRILRGDRVGIIGPNGAGKTTLIRMLCGDLEPDSGTVTLGTGLAMVTLDQRRESLDPAATLADTLTGGRGDTVFVGGQPRHVQAYMKDFLFVPEQARTTVGVLSGGERGRLLLARALARPSNLLVLDEPTNDLDLDTLDLLQEVLADYPGTLLLVSHDRDFLDRTVTSVIVWEGEGRWREYPGGYADMVAQRGRGVEAKATDAARPPSPKAAVAKPAPPPPAKPARQKLGFKQKRALEELPGRIETLHGTIAGLRSALADPDLYARDPAGFQQRTAELERREAELAAAEEEWLALELLREEIEGA